MDKGKELYGYLRWIVKVPRQSSDIVSMRNGVKRADVLTWMMLELIAKLPDKRKVRIHLECYLVIKDYNTPKDLENVISLKMIFIA